MRHGFIAEKPNESHNPLNGTLHGREGLQNFDENKET
jgi:hypothetical protein